MAGNISTYKQKDQANDPRPEYVTGTDVDTEKRALDTFVKNPVSDPVNVSGSFAFSGLNIAGRITQVSLNASTWTALPATALANRNAMSIQNISGTEIKIQYDNAVVGYVGVTIKSGDERFYDITENVIIYAKSASGTPVVQVEELS